MYLYVHEQCSRADPMANYYRPTRLDEALKALQAAPLTIVAGVMREPLWRFTLIVAVAKGGRYLLLSAATLGWMA